MRPRALLFALPMLLTACGPTQRLEVPVTHPANADAAESPVPERSTTLAVNPQLQALPPLTPPSATDEHEHHHSHGPKQEP